MLSSKFYKRLHKNKASIEKALESVNKRIKVAMQENDYVHVNKLTSEALQLKGELMAYEDMIDEFDNEFYKED